jgi:hypothetical protein
MIRSRCTQLHVAHTCSLTPGVLAAAAAAALPCPALPRRPTWPWCAPTRCGRSSRTSSSARWVWRQLGARGRGAAGVCGVGSVDESPLVHRQLQITAESSSMYGSFTGTVMCSRLGFVLLPKRLGVLCAPHASVLLLMHLPTLCHCVRLCGLLPSPPPIILPHTPSPPPPAAEPHDQEASCAREPRRVLPAVPGLWCPGQPGHHTDGGWVGEGHTPAAWCLATEGLHSQMHSNSSHHLQHGFHQGRLT